MTGVFCPLCRESDQVEKVSTIYLEGIGAHRLLRKIDGQDQPANRPGQRLTKIPAENLYGLSRKLAPPSSGKRAVMRPIHPDMVVVLFSGILPVFLAGILSSQRQMLLPVIAILLGFYGLYLWRRKDLIARYEFENEARREAGLRVERGIKQWMKLHYCARDDHVFVPGEERLVPVDEMVPFLLGEE